MGFGKFGARPRGVNNPIYWVNRYRQDEKRQLANNQFNEKWHRLCGIHEELINSLVKPLNGQEIDQKIALKLINYTHEAAELRESINAKIDTCSKSELSKYATALKKVALLASKVCTELQIYNDIKNAKYDAQSKSVFLNESITYFLG